MLHTDRKEKGSQEKSIGIMPFHMSASTKSVLKSLLRGLAWLLFATAGLTFWFGGRAINEFGKTERVLAEMEGIGLAVLCAGLGAAVKAAGQRLAEAEDDEMSLPAAPLK